MNDFLRNGDLVDVLIRGAVLHNQSDRLVALNVPGVDDPIVVPLGDDGDTPLHDTVLILPAVRPGQVWRSVETGIVLFATETPDGIAQLISGENKAYLVAEVVELWGRLEQIQLANPLHPAPVAGPTPDAIQAPATDVRPRDLLHTPAGWHTVLDVTSLADAGYPGEVLICTDRETLGMRCVPSDVVWIRRPLDGTPVYAELEQPSPLPNEADAWKSPSADAAHQPATETSRDDEAATVVMQAVSTSPDGPAQ